MLSKKFSRRRWTTRLARERTSEHPTEPAVSAVSIRAWTRSCRSLGRTNWRKNIPIFSGRARREDPRGWSDPKPGGDDRDRHQLGSLDPGGRIGRAEEHDQLAGFSVGFERAGLM